MSDTTKTPLTVFMRDVVASLLLFAVPLDIAHAGVAEGLAAHDRGDFATAHKEFMAAALGGDATAQNSLGVMYDNGRGVPKDDRKAVNWYRKAADQGYADAQFNLGIAYDNGQGVPKDEQLAVSWYRKAADQGNAEAQNNLGTMYEKGQGVSKDEKQAAY